MIIGNSNGWAFGESQKHKITDIAKGAHILDVIGSIDLSLVKTASSGQSDVLKVVAEALAGMGVVANIDIGELLKRLAAASQLQKTAAEEDGRGSKDETIKIASKRVDDSHIFIDVSKDSISKNGKSLLLVCAYVREGYLGRFMMKRNVYFLPDNAKDASEAYDEMVKKAKKVRERYYDGKIGVNDIGPEFKSCSDSIKGDLEFKDEDKIGANVYIDRSAGHEVAGPTYIRKT
jgi:hypothetical protein